MARKRKEVPNEQNLVIEEANNMKRGEMNTLADEIRIAVSEIHAFVGADRADLLERKAQAVELYDTARELAQALKALDEIEEEYRSNGILFFIEKPINELRTKCINILKTVSESEDMKIALAARTAEKVQKQKAEAVKVAKVAAENEQRERAGKAMREKWFQLLEDGIPQREVWRWEDKVDEQGHVVLNKNTRKPIQQKVLIRPACSMSVVEVVSRRLNKTGALNGLTERPAKDHAIGECVRKIAWENDINPAVLPADVVKETVAAVVKYRRDYHNKLNPQHELVATAVVSREARYNKDEVEKAAAVALATDEQLAAAMLAPRDEEE